jgi:hypothetical protein
LVVKGGNLRLERKLSGKEHLSFKVEWKSASIVEKSIYLLIGW